MTKHKHAELIKAWADGAQIEYRGTRSLNWEVIVTPSWNPDCEYRIQDKWAKERKAYEEGATIEYYNSLDNYWYITANPSWNPNITFRVAKTETTVTIKIKETGHSWKIPFSRDNRIHVNVDGGTAIEISID